MNLTDNFTLAGLTASETAARRGLDNTPPGYIVTNLRTLALKLEECRRILGRPLTVTSGYRSPIVNQAVGSKPSSAHVQGLAADFICPKFGSPLAVAAKLASSGITFDQLIHEFGAWIHIGLRADGVPWRGQVLTIDRDGTQVGLGVR